jgi:hypothetical protein
MVTAAFIALTAPFLVRQYKKAIAVAPRGLKWPPLI